MTRICMCSLLLTALCACGTSQGSEVVGMQGAGDVSAGDVPLSLKDGDKTDAPELPAADVSSVTGDDIGPAPDSSDGGVAGGQIAIYLKGVQDPPPADGLSGQTPSDFQVALSRYEVLTSATDPKPQPCFDYGPKTAIADLSGDNLMGSCPTSAIATGMYTHGRTKVDWSRFSVVGFLHYGGYDLAGTFTFLRAWSDTTIEGKAYAAGSGTLRFHSDVPPVDNEIPYTYPPVASVPGATMQTVGGEFTITFAYTKPLPIVHDALGSWWARFNWHVKDGFRWQDLAQPGFGPGVWDVTMPPAASDPVMSLGATGYDVTSSVD